MNAASKHVLINSSGTTSGITTLTGTVDTVGYNYAQIAIYASSDAALHTTAANNALEEADASTGTYVAVSAAAPGTGWTVSTATIASTGPKIVYNVDLRGRKRFLKVTGGLAATANAITIAATLHKGSDAPVSASEQGSGQAVTI